MANRRFRYRKATARRGYPAVIHDMHKIIEVVQIQHVFLGQRPTPIFPLNYRAGTVINEPNAGQHQGTDTRDFKH